MNTPLYCIFSLALASGVINRKAIVSRHNITIKANSATALDTRNALTIGNGEFAINVDA
jgi:hypothetical protein